MRSSARKPTRYRAIKAEFHPVDAEYDALPKPRMVYAGSSYFPRAGTFRPALLPRPVYVLARGNVRSPGNAAAPGALSCVTGLGRGFDLPDASDEGSRRAALA